MKNIINNREVYDIAFSIFLIIFCVAILRESSTLEQSAFDQLGSSFFPQLISCLIILLCGLVIIKNLTSLSASGNIKFKRMSLERKSKFIQVFLISILTVSLVAGISLKTIPFSILVGMFLSLSIFTLSGCQWKNILWVVIGSFLGGGFLEVVFTQVFVMDLPRFQIEG